MLLCGTATMKILDILFKLEYENIWVVGFRVGFAVWLFLLTVKAIFKLKISIKFELVEEIRK